MAEYKGKIEDVEVTAVVSTTTETPHPANESSAPGPYEGLKLNRPPCRRTGPTSRSPSRLWVVLGRRLTSRTSIRRSTSRRTRTSLRRTRTTSRRSKASERSRLHHRPRSRPVLVVGHLTDDVLQDHGARRRRTLQRNGDRVQRREVDNLVVTSGKQHIADQLSSSPGDAAMGWMAVGTSATAAAAGDTLLGAEIDRNALTSRTDSGAVVTYVGDWAAGDATNAAIAEAGIFNIVTANTVSMLARATFTAINKGASDTLKITWTVTSARRWRRRSSPTSLPPPPHRRRTRRRSRSRRTSPSHRRIRFSCRAFARGNNDWEHDVVGPAGRRHRGDSIQEHRLESVQCVACSASSCQPEWRGSTVLTVTWDTDEHEENRVRRSH